MSSNNYNNSLNSDEEKYCTECINSTENRCSMHKESSLISTFIYNNNNNNNNISLSENKHEQSQQQTNASPTKDSMSETKDAGKRKRIVTLSNRNDNERWVNLTDKRLKPGRLGSLFNGSKFVGIQKGNSSQYDVTVEIQDVDLKNHSLSGYLHISGLTASHPDITTFFEGEIIGPKHSFLTRKWLADLTVDTKHWKRFPSFEPLLGIFNNDEYHYDPIEGDYIYMRWKEKFLVPDHHVKDIDGASYSGFYYICYEKSTSNITGFYYYHKNNDWYQELSLKYIPSRQFYSYEFQ
ncbi:unnamed protein product [Cunninghamella blakesleeana]